MLVKIENLRAMAKFYLPIIVLACFYLLILTATNLVQHWNIRSKGLLVGECLSSTTALIWCVIRFTRNSDQYIKSNVHGSMLEVWGGYLAIFWLLSILTVNLWGGILFFMHPPDEELFTERMDRLHASTYTLEAVEDGRVLLLEGDLSHGVTRIMRALLDQNPNVSELRLHSKGGNIFEARGMAKLVVTRKMKTHVVKECSSACTIVFIAGIQRTMSPDARLGFHQYALQYGLAHPSIDIEAQQQKDASFFRTQGVTEDFLKRIFNRQHTEIWYPSQTELRLAGVLVP